MYSRFRISTTFLTVCLCVWLINIPSAADVVDLETALASQVQFDFEETPLAQLLESVSRRYKVPIVADRMALEAAGRDLSEIVISCQIADLPLAKALEALLAPIQLQWIARHDVVLVTTDKAAAEDYYETRVYKVTRRVPADRRMRSIMWSVEPTSWSTTGGKGDAAPLMPNLLLVYQSPLLHRQIAQRFASSVVPVRAPHDADPRSGTELEKKLRSPTFIDVKSQRLVDVMGRLGDTHSIAIKFDKQSLDEAGIPSDDLTVTLQVGELRTLASGLSLLLEQSDSELRWLERGNEIAITTAGSAACEMVRETYEVKEILHNDDIAQLIDAVQYAVAPTTWEQAGGYATIESRKDGTKLEILQCASVHRILRRLFADLRVGRTPKNQP